MTHVKRKSVCEFVRERDVGLERQIREEDGGGGSSRLIASVACQKKWQLKDRGEGRRKREGELSRSHMASIDWGLLIFFFFRSLKRP